MFSMKKIKKLLIVAATVGVITSCITGCGSNLYKTGHRGYTKVYDAIKGYGFEIQSGMLDSATAVTNISDDHDYSKGTFLYKNGDDTYLVFNINSFVIAVSNKTSFNFDKKADIKQVLKKKDMNGIWFAPEKKPEFKQQTKHGNKKTEINVIADVSITEDLFGTFSGKLTTIKSKTGECSMFMGVLADDYKSVSSGNKGIISNVSNSLTTVNSSDEDGDQYVVQNEIETQVAEVTRIPDTESNNDSSEVVSLETETEEDPQDSVSVTVINDTQNDDTETGVNAQDESDTQISKPAQVQKDSQTQKESEKAQQPKPQKDVTKKTKGPAKDTEADSEKKELSDKKNNKASKKDSLSKKLLESVVSAEGKESDLYHQLKVGQTGECTAMGEHGSDVEADVCVTHVYTGKSADKLLKKLKSNDEYIKDLNTQPGTSLQVAEYKMSEDPEKAYIDFKIIGLDGGTLKYRGVPFGKRTYDAKVDSTFKDGFYKNLYVIYEVPNGCTEYSLQIGSNEKTAYCHVKIKQ